MTCRMDLRWIRWFWLFVSVLSLSACSGGESHEAQPQIRRICGTGQVVVRDANLIPVRTARVGERVELTDASREGDNDLAGHIFVRIRFLSDESEGWVTTSYMCQVPDAGSIGDTGIVVPASGVLSETQVVSLLAKAGVAPEHRAFLLCVAQRESELVVEAYNENRDDSNDFGLFQINDRYWPADTAAGPCGTSERLLHNPLENAHCARKVLETGPHYGRHWSTFSACKDLYRGA